MILSKGYGSAVFGVDAQIITIEVNVVDGTKFFMSGLPDNTVKESQHRIESVFKYLEYRMPRRKVVVNLAPAGIRKEGSAYDLPMALGILILRANQGTQNGGLYHYGRTCLGWYLKTY